MNIRNIILMQRIDKTILQALQEDGRISNKDLAAQVSLSTSPCWRRVRDLEREGLVDGYVALLNREALGFGLLALVHISLDNHHAETVDAFDRAIQDWPQVLECHKISGEYDYMLKVVARDLASYDQFISMHLQQLAFIRAMNTTFSMRQPKYTTALPLELTE